MEFRTIVNIEKPDFEIMPMEKMLFVGSCFADNIGRRFVDNKFNAIVNPYGVMYNPASILHTVERLVKDDREQGQFSPRVVFFTLGTNHIYRLKETGEIVDNCQKRPARLFQEEELSVDQCADYIMKAASLLQTSNPDVRIVLTVSPIRYAKYGYHISQLSKATLLLAAHKCITLTSVNDELRDYRFCRQDMIHPSDQAVEYIWERLVETCFSESARRWLSEWKPVSDALNHRPFNPDSEEYKAFMKKTHNRIAELKTLYPELHV